MTDEQSVILEGKWPYDKVVIMSFADRSAADAFITSKDYREIAVDRIAGASAVVLMARGTS